MKEMKLSWVIVLFSIILFSQTFTQAQLMKLSSIISSDITSSESAIRAIVDQITQGVRIADVHRIMNCSADQTHDKEVGLDLNNTFATAPDSGEKAAFSFHNLSILVNGQDAHVSGFVNFPKSKVVEKVTFKLHKSSQGIWKIISSVNFINTVKTFVKQYGTLTNAHGQDLKSSSVLHKGNLSKSVPRVTSVTPLFSTHILLPIPFGWDIHGTPIWQVTQSDAQAQFSKPILFNPVDIDYAALGHS